MRTIGFPISHKEHELRRSIVPEHILDTTLAGKIYIEKGYGDVLGIADSVYERAGCKICSREEVLEKDIICDPKIGDAEYLDSLRKGQIIFGWVHATQNREITDKLISNGLTAYAWEKMNEDGRHIFWQNNELAGEAAVIHASQCFGRLPFGTKVAVIGKGNTARGAMRSLNRLGAETVQYDRHTEVLLRKEIGNYDAIVNCVLWDVMRKDHLVYREDLKRMKPGSIIIDVSCDRHGAIETSEPTTIENPIYYVDNICHYVVDHTPSLFYKTFSFNNSEVIQPYIKELMTDTCGEVLKNSLIFKDGIIIDEEICRFQNRTK